MSYNTFAHISVSNEPKNMYDSLLEFKHQIISNAMSGNNLRLEFIVWSLVFKIWPQGFRAQCHAIHSGQRLSPDMAFESP